MANKTYHARGVLVHGYSVKKHPFRNIWDDMKQRCSNPKCPAWPHYGGRGITYCPEWEHFANFANDMWPRPEGLELDRRENDKGYSKDNCRWSTRSVNCGNRRVFKNSVLGICGVREVRPGVFSCLYQKDKVRYRLGCFDTATEATAFREAFKVLLVIDIKAAEAMLAGRI